MELPHFNDGLFRYLRRSPTPFHAVAEAVRLLVERGFTPLNEADGWSLTPGQRYLVTRNGSSLIAFVLGQRSPLESGIRMVGAHTDSPCLRVKPEPVLRSQGCLQLGVELYGGVLLNPWFDRDLSLAGRATCLTTRGELVNLLIDLKKPLAVIPSLAIHLDRDANSQRSINAQNDLPPILLQLDDRQSFSFTLWLREQLQLAHPEVEIGEVLGHDLSFYDPQPPAYVGWDDQFIASARLDNLLSCHVALAAIAEAGSELSTLIVLNDHEEVGSGSAAGAQGPFLRAVLERMVPGSEALTRAIDRSLFVSADNAHGIHPNHAAKHDANHGPRLNQGPVIKFNASQRYASNSETAAWFRHLCTQSRVPVQSFAVRSDMGCGSTIGPLTAAEIGVRTVDVGVPTFAMHSIRELAGRSDAHHLYRVIKRLFATERLS
ncbi:MAG TPA: M18 family aminopeptidase [Pseudomonadales bacterium]|nr:M18 family aminopeptidase [Pseudomonadales bacterium]